MAASSSKSPLPHSIRGMIAGGDMPAKLSRFGPVYGADTKAIETAKDEAWTHIVKDNLDEENVYLRSIAKIEEQALGTYDPELNLKKGTGFREKMVKDGCFFIQLALHILGGWELLGYPKKHPYFGEVDQPKSWIPAMFFVGNQIPWVVIRALMKQSFFVKVIKEGRRRSTWRRQRGGDDLAKLVLYRTVVEPELVKGGGCWYFKSPPCYFKSPPSDILHALHTMLLGPADDDPNYSEMKDFHDLEAGLDDSEKKFPTADELYKEGITLRKAKTSSGITNIHFKNRVFWAYLDVPPLTIDAHTRDLLTNLAKYEKYGLSESDREVTSYLRFMRDLAHSYKDFKILEKKGIIHVKDQATLKGESLQMLNTIVSDNKCNFTLNFRQTRHMIKGYGGPPWRIISIALGVLTIVQTIFTVLSYFIPPP